MANAIILVCDDAGYGCVDRGILELARRTNLPLCADYLIEQEGAAGRAKEMSSVPNVSIGIHFELSGMSDADRVKAALELARNGTSLGEQEEIRAMAERDARRQLGVFRDALGRDPAHVSTHGNFNADPHDRILPWWHGLMHGLFGDAVPPMQLDAPYIRHNLYGWNLPEREHRPLTPDEFEKKLEAHVGCDYLEFVMHPALPKDDGPALDMLFTADMRVADLKAAIDILQSGIIAKAGFAVAPVSSLATRP